MGIYIKIAETAEELDGLFCARHKVFVEEGGYMDPRSDGKISDHFDTYPSSVVANIIVVDDGRVVGGVRFTKITDSGMPPDEFFDFSPYIPEDTSKVGSGSMFCLESAYRQSRIAFYMLAMGHYWASSEGLSHMLCAINPEIENFTIRIGYKSIAPQVYDETKKLPFVPMILDMKDLSALYRRFARAQHGNTFYLPQRVPSLNNRKSTSILHTDDDQMRSLRVA